MSEQPGLDSAGHPVLPLDRGWISLGHEHWYREHDHGQGVTIGLVALHKQSTTGRWCISGITYDIPEAPERDPEHRWQLISRDPLHVEPSLLCRAPNGPIDPATGFATLCSDHGFIRGGVWVPA